MHWIDGSITQLNVSDAAVLNKQFLDVEENNPRRGQIEINQSSGANRTLSSPFISQTVKRGVKDWCASFVTVPPCHRIGHIAP